MAKRVARARETQRDRYSGVGLRTNAEAEGELLDRIAKPDSAGQKLLMDAAVVPSIMRYTRSAMLEALGQDYVRTARGKGLPEMRVIGRHALRNALLSVVTVLGVLAPILIGATAVIESVFAMPGVGRLAVEAALSRDYPTIMTLNFLTAALVLLSNVVVDVSYVILDPRIRLD